MATSIAQAILQGTHRLRQADVPEPHREAGSLMAFAIGRDRSFILSHAEDAIDEDQLKQFYDFLERRAQREPLQYITGHQEFFGLDFEVSGDVLIPRPETELLVETALKLAGPRDGARFICDVGTGSGCIAISLLHELRETPRSEERRVGKECRSRWSRCHKKRKKEPGANRAARWRSCRASELLQRLDGQP